jgi:hypothetical protein
VASLLIRTIAGENALRYAIGDVVAAVPDDHVFGRMEDRRVWIAEGNDPAAWPGGFAVLELPGLSVEAARQYLAEGTGIRRAWKVDFLALERRAPVGGRDTLRLDGWISRAWADADVPSVFSLKA